MYVPLFVQADSGENKRYCESQEINEVPDTLDQEIWPLDLRCYNLLSKDCPMIPRDDTDHCILGRLFYLTVA